MQYASIPFTISDGVSLSVGLYHNIYPAKKPSAVFVDGRTNAPLKVETSWMCKSTGKRLLPHEIKTYFPFGGDSVSSGSASPTAYACSWLCVHVCMSVFVCACLCS